MRCARLGLGLLLFAGTAIARGEIAGVPRATEQRPPAPPCAVKTLDTQWLDAARQRLVPVRAYYPEPRSRRPVVLMPHCPGESRADYVQLCTAWAAQGYVVVHLQKRNGDVEDRPGWRARLHLRPAGEDADSTIQRAGDMLFALNELELVNQGRTELRGRLDLERIGAAGHAFGALTALNVAGQPLATAAGPRSFADARVKAVLAMSAPPPGQRDALPDAYCPIRVPVMHVTGARAEQRLPNVRFAGVDQVLIAFRDGDPVSFLARKLAIGERRKDLAMQELLVRSSLLFWDAYLKGDGDARQTLQRLGGAAKPLAAVEFKPAA